MLASQPPPESSSSPSSSPSASFRAASAEKLTPHWTMREWVASLDGLRAPLSDAMLAPVQRHLGVASTADVPNDAAHAFVRALAGVEQGGTAGGTVPTGRAEGVQAIRALLESADVLEALSGALYDASVALARPAEGGGAAALHSKFSQDPSAFHLEFGGLSTFYRGLEGCIGPPAPNLAAGMFREHCESEDSRRVFEAANYGTRTTAEVEYYFVCSPDEGEAELRDVSEHGWPVETLLSDRELDELGRRPQSLQAMMHLVHRKNEELRRVDTPALLDEEVYGSRLYTGPMYEHAIMPSSSTRTTNTSLQLAV